MAVRSYLKPVMVNQTYERLLAADPNEAVSMDRLAEALALAGIKNPRTKKAPTRQGVHYILSHKHNSVGQRLLQQNAKRLSLDIRE